MEAAVKGDELVALRCVARELDRALNRFGAGVSKEHFLGFSPRHCRHKLLGELRQMMVIEIRAGNVNQFRGLFLHRFHHLWVAVPRGANGNARGKIQK